MYIWLAGGTDAIGTKAVGGGAIGAFTVDASNYVILLRYNQRSV
jgi:hypothetical protein